MLRKMLTLLFVRPSLEYAACIWDPYHEYLTYDIEKFNIVLQGWFSRIIVTIAVRVTDMLNCLKWLTLCTREKTC